MIKRLLAAVLAFLAMSVFAAVDVNKATSAELDAVKGIGPAIASKITAERAKGPFKDWPDLITRISGIGEKSAAKLSENGLTVNGSSYNGAVPAAPATTKAATKAAAPTAATAPAAATAPTAATPAAPATDAKAAAKAEKAAAKQAKKDKADADAKAKAEAKAEKKDKKKAKDADAAASAAKK